MTSITISRAKELRVNYPLNITLFHLFALKVDKSHHCVFEHYFPIVPLVSLVQNIDLMKELTFDTTDFLMCVGYFSRRRVTLLRQQVSIELGNFVFTFLSTNWQSLQDLISCSSIIPGPHYCFNESSLRRKM